MSVKPRVKVSEGAKAGDIIEVKTVIQHVMETGQRRDGAGNLVPRDIIHTFTASFGGQVNLGGNINIDVDSGKGSYAIGAAGRAARRRGLRPSCGRTGPARAPAPRAAPARPSGRR